MLNLVILQQVVTELKPFSFHDKSYKKFYPRNIKTQQDWKNLNLKLRTGSLKTSMRLCNKASAFEKKIMCELH